MQKEEINRLVINASATAQLLHELLDELSETTYYRQTLKNAINKLQMELKKTCDNQTNGLWSADDESMGAVQAGMAETIKVLVDADPLRIAAMGELLIKNPKAMDELNLV